MDPYIESQIWTDFHSRFITDMSDALVPSIRPHYVARIEERVYLEHDQDTLKDYVRPDIAIVEQDHWSDSAWGGTATATAVAPEVMTLPMPQQQTEAYLTIRKLETKEVVTVIELLSPGNKAVGSDGRQEYLDKREKILQSSTHLVELDLLRGGERLPVAGTLPAGDYYAWVSRSNRRPRVYVYAWPLRRPLPPVPIPLAGDDPDVMLDLQAAFSAAYDRAGYDYSLDYDAPVAPPLTETDEAWAQQTLDSVASRL